MSFAKRKYVPLDPLIASTLELMATHSTYNPFVNLQDGRRPEMTDSHWMDYPGFYSGWIFLMNMVWESEIQISFADIFIPIPILLAQTSQILLC